MGCGIGFRQLNELESALNTLIRSGLGPGNNAYDLLYKARGEILGKMRAALPLPRRTDLLKIIPMLSPGEVKLFHDVEVGWIAEGVPEPGAVPVIRRISQEEAERLMRAEPDRELAHKLLEPDPYLGE